VAPAGLRDGTGLAVRHTDRPCAVRGRQGLAQIVLDVLVGPVPEGESVDHAVVDVAREYPMDVRVAAFRPPQDLAVPVVLDQRRHGHVDVGRAAVEPTFAVRVGVGLAKLATVTVDHREARQGLGGPRDDLLQGVRRIARIDVQDVHDRPECLHVHQQGQRVLATGELEGRLHHATDPASVRHVVSWFVVIVMRGLVSI